MKTDANRLIPVLVSLVFAVALPGRAEEQSNPGNAPEQGKLSSSDQKFLTEAARGGMKEVRLGEIARNQASGPAVKDFAERLVTDHTKANEELKSLASQNGFVLPTELSDDAHREIDRMSKLSGAEFDREFIAAAMEDHQQGLKSFRDAAERADDAEVKAFASRTADVIEQHLDTAKQLQAQQKSGAESSSATEPGASRETQSSHERKTMREREAMKDDDNRDESKDARDKDQRNRTVTKEKRITRE